MAFLVDVDVLSEPTKPTPASSVVQWLARNDAQLGTNPIILGELQFGIGRLPAGRRRSGLLRWFEGGVRRLRMYDIDAETAGVWAQVLVELQGEGRVMPVKDSLIAATARQHGLTVATRNVEDYRWSGVKLVNPFDGR